ncbi:Rod shape-determining protein MreD [Candidatus Rhodobacter oscarellae]|uniref:Rod shape-determining protein MreD n=1 Tax=Candidatus Rhodobacter oscarellae TaxID=1675527 RepID=A0A0J9EAK3_9RHOB|nr:rod shape-determining protein MreD [Candidatus Rhodobacter lobularis]KMW59825.1 Rod shape-determining protein MreD [Candidatus Rhodobacter lobularis]
MAERTMATRRWFYGCTFFVISALIILLHLVPLRIVPGRIPGPDLLVCFTFAWLLRRPHYVPVLLIAVMFLMSDVLFMRPLGLWAALVVLGSEFLRARETAAREQPFPMEWGMVAAVLLCITLANAAVLAVLVVGQPALGLTLFQYVATVLCYPLVVLLSRWVFKLTKMTPNQTDARGRPR